MSEQCDTKRERPRMNFIEVNRSAWNQRSRGGGPWSTKVSKELVEKARRGDVQIFVTTTSKNVPTSWLPSGTAWKGLRVLGLAAGGGQQMPLIAAAGAVVTVLDVSEQQLMRDEEVCHEEGLSVTTVCHNMQDLSMFDNCSFDMVINPVSNCYVDDVKVVWKECFRVLKPGGCIISGFNNPVAYAITDECEEKGELLLSRSIPYSDERDLPPAELHDKVQSGDSLEFGHSLTDLIGGQMEAGFIMQGFYEDYWGDKFDRPLDRILPQFLATRSVKP